MKAALVDDSGTVLRSTKLPTLAYEGPEAVLARLGEMALALEGEAGQTARAVGVGLPGWVDSETGIARWLPNLGGGWRDIDASGPLAAALGRSISLINDVRAATLGELRFGHGQTYRSFAFLALGTGIGGGVVIDGRLRLGPLGSAGEVGHQIVEANGRPCGCGGYGCVEAYASGPALAGEGVRLMLSGKAPKLHELLSGDVSKVDAASMAQAARAGDDAVRDAIARAGRYLGLVATNLGVTLHPDAIVFGGGMARLGDLLLDPIRATLDERLRVFESGDIELLVSRLGVRAGLLGAAATAMASESA